MNSYTHTCALAPRRYVSAIAINEDRAGASRIYFTLRGMFWSLRQRSLQLGRVWIAIVENVDDGSDQWPGGSVSKIY